MRLELAPPPGALVAEHAYTIPPSAMALTLARMTCLIDVGFMGCLVVDECLGAPSWRTKGDQHQGYGRPGMRTVGVTPDSRSGKRHGTLRDSLTPMHLARAYNASHASIPPFRS